MLFLFMLLPLLSLSQNFGNFVGDGVPLDPFPISEDENYIQSINPLERMDWEHEADRKVNMFYKYLSYLIDADIDHKTKREAAVLALDLFVDNAEVCDSILIENKQQAFNHDISDFLTQMIEFDRSNVQIDYLTNSDNIFFDINTSIRTYSSIESITFTRLSKKIIHSVGKIIVVHLMFIENPVDNKANFVVKLGNISFSK